MLAYRLRKRNNYSANAIGMLILLFLPVVTVLAAKPPETRADYLALVGQSFMVSRIGKGQEAWSKAVDLKLAEITESVQDKNGKTEQFILRFQGAKKDKVLDKAVHRFEHATTGPFTLFLESAGGDKKFRYYRAVFNLLKNNSK